MFGLIYKCLKVLLSRCRHEFRLCYLELDEIVLACGNSISWGLDAWIGVDWLCWLEFGNSGRSLVGWVRVADDDRFGSAVDMLMI